MAFHAMGFWIAAAVIVRMLIAVAKVFEIGSEIDYHDTFGDGYSLILLFLIGFLSYKKHRGMCASVNLSFPKTILCISFAAIIISIVFAAFDIGMVKGYFTEIYKAEYYGYFPYKPTFLENMLIYTPLHRNPTFFEECGVLMVAMPLYYLCTIMLGYMSRHMLSCNPFMLLSWISAVVIIGYIAENSEKYDEFMTMLTILIIVLYLLFSASPIIFIFAMSLFTGIKEFPLFILTIIPMAILNILIIILPISSNKYNFPKENRKDLTL